MLISPKPIKVYTYNQITGVWRKWPLIYFLLHTCDSGILNNFRVGEDNFKNVYVIMTKQSSSPLEQLIYLIYFCCPGKYFFRESYTFSHLNKNSEDLRSILSLNPWFHIRLHIPPHTENGKRVIACGGRLAPEARSYECMNHCIGADMELKYPTVCIHL